MGGSPAEVDGQGGLDAVEAQSKRIHPHVMTR